MMRKSLGCSICCLLVVLGTTIPPARATPTDVPTTQQKSRWSFLHFGKRRLFATKRKRQQVGLTPQHQQQQPQPLPQPGLPTRTSISETKTESEVTSIQIDPNAAANEGETAPEGMQIIFPSIVDKTEPEADKNELDSGKTMVAPSQPLSATKDKVSVLSSVLAFLRNRRPFLTKCGIAGLQIGLSFWLARTLWQVIRETFEEFEENGLKSPLIAQVLEDLAHNRPPHDVVLARLAGRLQYLTSWPLRDDGSGKPSIEALLYSLTKSEYQILEQCLFMPNSNTSTEPGSLWSSIHGLPDVQHALLDRLSSLRFCEVHNPFASVLKTNANSGILLYGPPGCGKTMMLTAVCATIRMPCLTVTPSVLLKKYVGETNQQIRSLFSLAQKLGDCVICLDEIDGLFRERRADEHDVIRELKTEFFQWWDGVLQQDRNSRVLLIGATNRPFEVDPAVLRRMPQSHFIGQPVAAARHVILKSLLDKIKADPDIAIHEVIAVTEGYSPSDLVQLLRTAVLQGPMREARYNGNSHGHFRPLTTQDLKNAKMQVGPTPLSHEYRRALIEFHQRQQGALPPGQPSYFGGELPAVQMTPFGNFLHAGTFSVDEWGSPSESLEDGYSSSSESEPDESDDSTDDDL